MNKMRRQRKEASETLLNKDINLAESLIAKKRTLRLRERETERGESVNQRIGLWLE